MSMVLRFSQGVVLGMLSRATRVHYGMDSTEDDVLGSELVWTIKTGYPVLSLYIRSTLTLQ